MVPNRGSGGKEGGEGGREGVIFSYRVFFRLSPVHTSDAKCLELDAILKGRFAVLGVCHKVCIAVRNFSYAVRNRSRPYSVMLLVL